MKPELLQWSHCILCRSPSIPFPIDLSPLSVRPTGPKHNKIVSATLESTNSSGQLTARERRQLRQERRADKTTNWKEEVEERLLKKPKKKYTSWTEQLNLDHLSRLGPQWWVVRFSRASGQDIAERLARSLARNYPDIDFKVYSPAVQVKKRLKNGSYSVQAKPLFPGCLFLRCVLNKEIHDFIRESVGVGGFAGSKVGNTIRQINKPKPISADDMEAIFRQAKEEQDKANQAFREREEQAEGIRNNYDLNIDSHLESKGSQKSMTDIKPKRRSKKDSSPGNVDKIFIPGLNVEVISGPFAQFTGSLKNLDHKSGKATVGFTVFGKESLVELDINEIIAATT